MYLKATFLLLLFTFISCSTKKKEVFTELETVNYIPYFLKVNEADSLYTVKDYKGCYRILDKLFKDYEPLNSINIYEYNSYVVSAFKTKNFANYKQKIEKAYLDFGGLMISGKLKDSILNVAKISSNDIVKLKQRYRSKLNDTLRSRILQMMNEDQSVRTDKHSEEGMEFYAKKHEKELDTIFAKYGYPSEKLIGAISYFDYDCKEPLANPFGILVHQSGNKNAEEKIIPIILSYVKKGKCSPVIFTHIRDKFEMINFKKQYYNTFWSADINIDTTITNRKKIDSLRQTIGFSTLTYELWKRKYQKMLLEN